MYAILLSIYIYKRSYPNRRNPSGLNGYSGFPDIVEQQLEETKQFMNTIHNIISTIINCSTHCPNVHVDHNPFILM